MAENKSLVTREEIKDSMDLVSHAADKVVEAADVLKKLIEDMRLERRKAKHGTES